MSFFDIAIQDFLKANPQLPAVDLKETILYKDCLEKVKKLVINNLNLISKEN